MKTHVSTYGKGLNKDISLDAMPSDMYLHAEDIRFFTDEGSSLAAGINIKGTSQIFQLAGSDEQLAGLLTGIHASTEKVLSSVTTYVTDVDKGFKDSVGVLENTIITLEETLTAYTSQIQNDVNRRG